MTEWVTWRSQTPILQPNKAWEEGGMLSAVSLHVDPGSQRLRLYYLALHREHPLDNVLCIAESGDGRCWVKPDMGNGTNIVMTSSGHETGWGVFMPTRILYEPEETNPAWRWKMVLWERPIAETPAGICLAVSENGLRWSHLHQRPITILEPDTDDPSDLQHYWMSPYPTRSGYGGLLLCHHTLDQTMDVQRVTSRDGWSWERADGRRPLLPWGKRGRFDSGMITATSMPCRFGERVLLPYNGRSTVHDQQQRFPEDGPIPPGVGLVELDGRILE